jgi:magnesium transporter
MSFSSIEGSGHAWVHASPFGEEEESALRARFKFHSLDYEDVRQDAELPKIDEYIHYVMVVLPLPFYHVESRVLSSRNLTLFLAGDATVTASVYPIPSVDRLFDRVRRHAAARRDILDAPIGTVAHRVLEAVFKETGGVLESLMREARELEGQVYESGSRETTKRLGFLRRNVLRVKHLLDPQRRIIRHLGDLKRPFLPEDMRVYFENIEDTLDGYGVILANLQATVDGLFEINETFLAYRTNDTVRALTVISVILLLPTLITSFYGMNVDRLPFVHHPSVVIGIITCGLVMGLIGIFFLIRPRR